MEIELKHLKNYLGTGLKCYGMGEATFESMDTDDEKPQLFTIEGMNDTWVEVSGRLKTVNEEIHIEDCIPHLLPLLALTERIPDGSVPIDVIREFNIGYVDFITSEREHWIGLYGRERWIGAIPHMIVEYLFANHFDIYGLLDSGLAIDKRTVK